jgi:hypothetical protein
MGVQYLCWGCYGRYEYSASAGDVISDANTVSKLENMISDSRKVSGLEEEMLSASPASVLQDVISYASRHLCRGT